MHSRSQPTAETHRDIGGMHTGGIVYLLLRRYNSRLHKAQSRWRRFERLEGEERHVLEDLSWPL